MGVPSEGAVTGVAVLFSVLAIVALGLRIFSNRKYQKSVEIDDLLILPAFFLVIADGVAVIYGAQTRLLGGHSLPGLSPQKYAEVNKFEWAFWMGHVLTIGLIKLSILFFFRRLFKGRTKRTAFDVVNWTLIVLVAGWTISFLISNAFACGVTPQALWTTRFWTEHLCVNTSAMNLSCSALDWIFDLAILIEPLVMISTLNFNLRTKLECSAMFAFSSLAVVAGLLRMIIWIGIDTHGTEHVTILGEKLSVADIRAVATQGIFWSEIEIGVGFLVGCLLPAAKAIDAMMRSSIFVKLKSLPSSTWQRARRNDSASSGPEKDTNSENSWPLAERSRKAGVNYYSQQMASIDRMPSNVDGAGDHEYLGNFSWVSRPGERQKELV